ncbi:alpha/beta hydrolase [Microbispora sp. NPDC049125]|uniref:alpha/beta hydrolase n=1 Tax=Microbispora sp. NPDC049125 TaxID=3154929 RepID=UPI003467E83B
MITRRTVLAGGLGGLGALAVTGAVGAALVEGEVLPGKGWLDRTLGRCGTVPAAPSAAGVVQARAFASRRRRVDVTAVTVLPSGVTSIRGLRVVVALHGYGATGSSVVRDLALDRYLTDAVARHGAPPFAIVAVDGGSSGYWHRRASGDDPLGMITAELLPLLRRQGALAGRVGVIGWSMGGYGALLLGRRLAGRTAAVVASSPALFQGYEDARAANPLAFDDAADFARNDVFAKLGALDGVAVRVDCGTSDPFAPMVRRLRQRLRPAGEMSDGCHDAAFWRSRLPDQLAFLGRALAA